VAGPFDGVRVVEVAAWTYVPGAGAIMADLGADVIKVEPPNGDPQRGLLNMLNRDSSGPNPFIEIPNRGKRSMTIDLNHEKGHEVFLKLIEGADEYLQLLDVLSFTSRTVGATAPSETRADSVLPDKRP